MALKILSSIINENLNLIGFNIEGTEKDFGGFDKNTKVTESIKIEELLKRGFSNRQLAAKNGKIIERGNFKINTLPTYMYSSAGYSAEPIDTNMYLTQRIVQNNENVGFVVQIGKDNCITKKLRYENVIMLSKWLKPANFIVRNSSGDKIFISGKPGVLKLEDLPVIQLGAESKAKRVKSSAKEKEQVGTINGALPNDFDVLDVYDFIKGVGGLMINLASEEYTTDSGEDIAKEEEAAGFKSLGIGEVAGSEFAFNPESLNVNGNFRKVGMATVDVLGQKVTATTFVYRTKNIFKNGENLIKKFGIAVRADKEDTLIKALGKSIALEKITDEAITKPISTVIDADQLVFYTIDTSKIDLISKKRYKESVLDADALMELVHRRDVCKLVSKAVGPRAGIINEIKKANGDVDTGMMEGRKLFGQYAMMSKEYLKAFAEAGIDVYSGEFRTLKAAKNNGFTAKSKSAIKNEDVVSIVYRVDGVNADKLSAKVIKDACEGDAKALDKVPSEVIEELGGIYEIEDTTEKLFAAREIYRKSQAELSEINRKLWLHTAAMYMAGNKNRIHTHDEKKWSVDESSRVKVGTAYIYNDKSKHELKVAVTGVTIK